MEHSHYEEVSLSEMTLSEDGATLIYPCPCGDTFELDLAEFAAGSNIAQCPTCSLTILVVATVEERKLFLKQHSPARVEADGG